MENFISISQFPKTLYSEKKAQLGLKDRPEDVIQKGDVVLIGTTITALKPYYLEKKSVKVAVVNLNDRYSCLNAYVIRPVGL